MIKVSLEVHEGAAPYRIVAQAENISQAVSIVKRRYPDHEVRVVFPIDSEEFFIEDPERIGAGESIAAPSCGLDRDEAGVKAGKALSGVSGGE
jgi:hypothetical protein